MIDLWGHAPFRRPEALVNLAGPEVLVREGTSRNPAYMVEAQHHSVDDRFERRMWCSWGWWDPIDLGDLMERLTGDSL